jgi:uncharacterized protein YjbI with pentapeptide repeats
MEELIEILDDNNEVLKKYRVPEGKCQFEGIVWEGAYLYGAQLADVCFKDAKLYWGGFFMAKLDGANFENAGLQGVDLKEASCIKTNFRGANLGRDNLGGSSQLQGANLKEAILNRANLEGAEYDGNTIFPKGFHPGSHGMIEKEA